MDTSFWISNLPVWAGIAFSAIMLWVSRDKILARPSGHAIFRTLVGANIAIAIVAFYLVFFTMGYSQGKARALKDNSTDQRVQTA